MPKRLAIGDQVEAVRGVGQAAPRSGAQASGHGISSTPTTRTHRAHGGDAQAGPQRIGLGTAQLQRCGTLSNGQRAEARQPGDPPDLLSEAAGIQSLVDEVKALGVGADVDLVIEQSGPPIAQAVKCVGEGRLRVVRGCP